MSIISPFSSKDLLPQEEKLELLFRRSDLQIGIPKEITFQEKRICLTPEAVGTLVSNGHQVLIEAGAGLEANYTDKEYAEAGAEITHDTNKVFATPILLKVEPPTIDEIKKMNDNALLISAIQLKTRQKEYIEALQKKKITAIAFEYIKESDGTYPVAKALSQIAGKASVLIAAEIIGNHSEGKGLLLGNITGVPPTEVVILGAGNVGQHAAKTAIGLGANVKVFDNSLQKLNKLQNALPSSIFTSTIQHKLLIKSLMRADVVIGAVKGVNRSPVIVTETMVENMKQGAVIVDVSIDTGGCFETSEVTTHANPTFVKHGVTHYCVPNISARYSKTASLLISNILVPYLLEVGEYGGVENAIRCNLGLKKGIYLYHGVLCNRKVGDWFGLNSNDVNLLVF
ncbi:MAG: alanine dehydrogenase [Bacteroidota bacterium]|nr:alanine dehydrogenase [Bacteroidota bacterium]